MTKLTNEERLSNAHNKAGIKRYGKRRWSNCNFGWFAEEDYTISSKVYGDPCMIFTTTREKNKYIHSEEEYI